MNNIEKLREFSEKMFAWGDENPNAKVMAEQLIPIILAIEEEMRQAPASSGRYTTGGAEPSQSETQWKPGQMLIAKPSYNPTVYKLTSLDAFGRWKYKASYGEGWADEILGGPFVAGYVPWPRVGDCAVDKSESHGVPFGVIEIKETVAWDKLGHQHRISDLEPASPPAEQAECGACVCHMIAGASFYPCALPRGHGADHRASGNCFAHGEYLGEPNMPPQCPKCEFLPHVGPAEQPEPAEFSEPWWKLGTLLLQDDAYGEAIKRDIDLKNAILKRDMAIASVPKEGK